MSGDLKSFVPFCQHNLQLISNTTKMAHSLLLVYKYLNVCLVIWRVLSLSVNISSLVWFGLMPLSTIFQLSWWSVLLVEETGVPGESHWPVASNWQTLSHNVISSAPRHELGLNIATLVVIGTDCIGSYKSNYQTITATTIPDMNLFIELLHIYFLRTLTRRRGGREERKWWGGRGGCYRRWRGQGWTDFIRD